MACMAASRLRETAGAEPMSTVRSPAAIWLATCVASAGSPPSWDCSRLAMKCVISMLTASASPNTPASSQKLDWVPRCASASTAEVSRVASCTRLSIALRCRSYCWEMRPSASRAATLSSRCTAGMKSSKTIR